MKYHFGDVLYRDGNYWSMVPNVERYAHRVENAVAGYSSIVVATIGKDDKNWEVIHSLPNLAELSLHEPSKEQLESISQISSLKRLRISHARPKSIDFLAPLEQVEELVLEYVSGFSDLSPIQNLQSLRSLHFENLRRVFDFSPLANLKNLEYLAIYGTLDWKQPIADFEFLRGLHRLEVLAFWEIVNKTPFPAMVPAANLKSLKEINLHRSYLAIGEYALLEVLLNGVKGANWGPYEIVADKTFKLPADDFRAHLSEETIISQHPEIRIYHDGQRVIDDPASRWFSFTGKGVRRLKYGSKNSEVKSKEFAQEYEKLKEQAKSMADSLSTSD